MFFKARPGPYGIAVTTLAVVGLAIGLRVPQTNGAEKSPVIISFKTAVAEPAEKNANVKYDLDPTSEKFAVVVPPDYKEQPGWGLVVFIGADGLWDHLPGGWEGVLKQRKLLAVIPQNAGNDQPTDRRLGMATLAAREMIQEHKIDPKRVYAAGFSGGARMAGLLGFFEPSLFKGTVQCCGADFYNPVPQVAERSPDDRTDDYGVFHATDSEIAAAKTGVRFCVVTGARDFRHAQILDVIHGGYQKAGFNVKLIDVPGMPHQACSAKQLTVALDFIEGVAPTTVPAAVVKPDPAGPLWGASDPKKWPQILAYNNGELTNNTGIGGSAFLLKLPGNGDVVAATAVHVFGDGVKAEDIDKLVKTWVLSPPGNSKKKIVVKKLATKSDPDAPMDCVLANVSASHSGLEPLTPRLSPPAVGESLWVLGLPEGTKGTQAAFKVTVVSYDEDTSEFRYSFDTEIDTNGFSGAPVMDLKGRVVGIHLGHISVEGKTLRYGIHIAAPIKQVPGGKK